MTQSAQIQTAPIAKHSPGPWRACKNGDCPCGHTWSIPDDFPVCTVLNEGGKNVRHAVAIVHTHMADAPDMIYATLSAERAKANLRLIAAAPEMFEALQALAFFNGKPANVADMERLGALFANARAALAKAST